MDSNQNNQLVMHAYELYGKGDIKGVLDHCADDVCWTSAEIDQVPFAGTFNGQYEVGEFFSHLSNNLDTIQFAPRDFIAEGDKVVVTGSARWHIKSTGADFGTEWVHIFTVKDGKVTRFEQFTDTAAAEAAFRGPRSSVQSSTELRH